MEKSNGEKAHAEALANKYGLILFDLDGTLADTHRLIFDSFNFVLRKYRSIEMTPQQILSYFGPPEEVCIKNMIGTDDFESVWTDFLEYYSTHLGESTVFEGVESLLQRLKSMGKLIGVLTAKGTRTADMTLEFHGLKMLFDVVVTGSQVRNHKPDPEGIELVLDTLGMDESETILVGDSPSDYKAAMGAGIDFIAVTYDNISKGRFDGIVCRKASSVAELEETLVLPEGGLAAEG